MLKPNVDIRGLLALLLVAVIASVSLPVPAKADGGPVAGPGVWEHLKEGQQIAVVAINDDGTADVDLFVSLLDTSGQSHEITYFLPLGHEVGRFNVYEQKSWDFQDDRTKELDMVLRQDARHRRTSVEMLFAGTLLVNGIWLVPLWAPLFFTGCLSGEPPQTFETESSKVSVYGLDDDTDLDSLISVTGLDPSVKNTLERLRGQRIAVVTLQTQPDPNAARDSNRPPPYYESGEPGLHLAWTTALTDGEDGRSYAYPLGTGESWFHPIELTRVYVTAPPGMKINVQYPKLGEKHSGFNNRGVPRIADYSEVAAYAIDEATGDFGQVWRATYTQSNAAEDIIITTVPASRWNAVSAAAYGLDERLLFLYAFIVALALWLLGWRYLVPRLLGESYQGSGGMLLKFALTYTGINFILMVGGGILYFFWSATGNFFTLLFLLVLFGGGAIWVFGSWHVKHLGSDENKAAKAFFTVSLASNGVYLVLSLGYLWLSGFF